MSFRAIYKKNDVSISNRFPGVHKRGNAALKARKLVHTIWVSSVATQKLIDACGKTAIADCSTRWSRTFLVLQRLQAIKPSTITVFVSLSWDYLLASEWKTLQEVSRLLAPFAEHTNAMQTDSMSMANILSVIIDLLCHLDDPSLNQVMSMVLKQAMHVRFDMYLEPSHDNFDPMQAADCLLEPCVAAILLSLLLDAAKDYILNQVCLSQQFLINP